MQIGKKTEIKVDGKKLKIAVVLPYFNEELGLELFENVKKELIRNNVSEKNITLSRVAGALELPFACKKIALKKPDAIIALGIVIRGETSHYDLVTETAHQGLMKVQLEEVIPIIFGILACENLKQVKDRISSKGLDKGKEFAQAALIQTLI
ncbi:6,7-dimethyl-8-ribityllumazine synthase [Candidatus Gracilibacteria bacterium]|nr:6,7-dimethyl-8-ribityllumazine synthase [Candidatus Gracilibacteria bacterium]